MANTLESFHFNLADPFFSFNENGVATYTSAEQVNKFSILCLKLNLEKCGKNCYTNKKRIF